MQLEENKYYVYCLFDPINNLPFYIGKGCGNRAHSHLKNNKERNVRKNKMIETIRLLGFEPEVKIIVDNLYEQNAYDIEYCIIKNAKYYNIMLTNRVGILKPPSRKNCILSQSTKDKISKSQSGVKKGPMKDETKLKLSLLNKGKNGPNKVFVDVDELKVQYVIENKTKSEICKIFNIGLGSLNRILKENNILKTKECFSL